MAPPKKENNEEVQEEAIKKRSKSALSPSEIRDLMNKKVGKKVSYDLSKEDPTAITDWVPTGSRLLDSIICEGKVAGIPMGCIVEMAGMPGCISEDEEIEVIVEE